MATKYSCTVVAVAQRLDRTRPSRQVRVASCRGRAKCGRGDGVVHGGVDGAEHANGRGARGPSRRRRFPALLGGQQPRADAVPPVEREALAALDVRVVGFEIAQMSSADGGLDVVRQAPGRREFLGEDRRTLSFVPQRVKSPGNRIASMPPTLNGAWPGWRTSSPAIFGRGCPSQVCQLRRLLVADVRVGDPPSCRSASTRELVDRE